MPSRRKQDKAGTPTPSWPQIYNFHHFPSIDSSILCLFPHHNCWGTSTQQRSLHSLPCLILYQCLKILTPATISPPLCIICFTVFTVQWAHSHQYSPIVGIYLLKFFLPISGLLNNRILKELCQFNSSNKSFPIVSSTCSRRDSVFIIVLTLILLIN